MADDFGFVKRDNRLLENAMDSEVEQAKLDNGETGSDAADGTESSEVDSNRSASGDGRLLSSSTSEPGRQSTSEPRTDGTRSASGTLVDPETVRFRSLSLEIASEVPVTSGASVPPAYPQDASPKATRPVKPGMLREIPPFVQPDSSRKALNGNNSGFGGILKKRPVMMNPKQDSNALPQSFQVKYLGCQDANGLWGIKHTRKPVDALVHAAKNLKANVILPMVKLVISKEGVSIIEFPTQKAKEETIKFHAIDTISYGVQDLVYTRVFSMIVVRESSGSSAKLHPFECHAFVCDSRNGARNLTYTLAEAFNEYSKTVKSIQDGDGASSGLSAKKKFAIDLRSPEEIECDLKGQQDSEA